MSYLVDALKKAERERHGQDAPDLRTATYADGDRRSGLRGIGLALIAILVASNVALGLYIWRPQSEPDSLAGRDAPAETADAASRFGVRDQASGASDSSADLPLALTTEFETPPASRPADSARTDTAVAARQASATTGSVSTNPSAPREHDAGVVYSDVPLRADDSLTSAAAMRATPAESSTAQPDDRPTATQTDAGAPPVQINGQLYSTVPGRSFILVDGHRYHEGERLAAGPAVEQIEPNGAILRYRDQRYHVPGPNG